jgi:thymidylate synthase
MQQYHDLLRLVLDQGSDRDDRTGTGTRSIFGHQMRFDLEDGLSGADHQEAASALDHPRAVVVSRGDTNIAYLKANKVSIWDEWADENGDLGPVYGAQWRSWPRRDGTTIDQIANVVRQIETNPDPRAATSSRPGTRPMSTTWRCRRVIACSSSMSPTASSPASSTSVRPTSSWACRSTSPPMRC